MIPSAAAGGVADYMKLAIAGRWWWLLLVGASPSIKISDSHSLDLIGTSDHRKVSYKMTLLRRRALITDHLIKSLHSTWTKRESLEISY